MRRVGDFAIRLHNGTTDDEPVFEVVSTHTSPHDSVSLDEAAQLVRVVDDLLNAVTPAGPAVLKTLSTVAGNGCNVEEAGDWSMRDALVMSQALGERLAEQAN